MNCLQKHEIPARKGKSGIWCIEVCEEVSEIFIAETVWAQSAMLLSRSTQEKARENLSLSITTWCPTSGTSSRTN